MYKRQGVDYHAIGEEYTDERYTRRCISILQEQFEGRRKETYVPDILDESYIIAYLPLRNADGEVMAVLGVDAKLGYSDFAQYGPINFERLTSISALLDVYKRQSLQRRMRQCWYFCICLRQFVYKRETRKEREKWKEVKFGKQHRNIRTDTVSYTHLDVYKRQAKGSVCFADGKCVYTPNEGTQGTDRFVLTALDEQGGVSAPIEVQVMIRSEG